MLKILKSNISEDILYNSWVEESYKIFSKFSDDDFFSNKVQHLYFYSNINNDTVNALQKILLDSSKTKMGESGVYISPKPICLHLNSPGGYTESTNMFYSIIQTQRVPLCIIIEECVASASTDIALLAPYRLMIDYSKYLIHDSYGGIPSKTSSMIMNQYSNIDTMIYYTKMLKKKTKLTDIEIREFLERDILLNADYCLNKGIIDRILRFPKINKPEYYNSSSNLQLNLKNFLKKTNLNHIYFGEEIYNSSPKILNGEMFYANLQEVRTLYSLSILLDNLFLINKNNVKPIIIHFSPQMNDYSNPINLIQLNYRIALIQKRVPIIAFIEGTQYFDSLGTIMSCPIRIMMKPSIITSNFSSIKKGSMGYGYKTIDIIDNSLFIYNNVIKFYKAITDIPDTFYKEMRHRILHLKSKDLLKYNIIHLCLNITKENIISKDIINYLQLK